MTSLLASLRTRLDSWPILLVFGVIYTASQLTIASIVHPLGPDMLIVQTTLSAEHVREIFARWDAAGVTEHYAAHYRFDMIHPLWYSVLLAAMLAKTSNRARIAASCNGLLVVPFVAGACDLLENFVHLAFLADRANITPTAVLLGNGAALSKWSLIVFVLATIGAFTVSAARSKRAAT